MNANGVPRQVVLAGAGVLAEALTALVATGILLTATGTAALPLSSVLGQAAFFVIVAGALGFVGWGLLSGRRWSRTPAIVTQLLLLPVVYSLIGASRQLVLGIVVGVVVAGTFLLLISDAARQWSVGEPEHPAR